MPFDLCSSAPSRRFSRGLLALLNGNANVERCACPHLAFEVERTAVRLLYNFPRNRESQARAHAHRLGGEALRKDLWPVFGPDSTTAVGYRNVDPVALATRAYRDFTLTLYRLPRIYQDIQEHLIEHARVALHRRQLAQVGLDRDAVLELAVRQLQRVLDLLVQVHLAQVCALHARERLQAANHFRNALARDLVNGRERTA